MNLIKDELHSLARSLMSDWPAHVQFHCAIVLQQTVDQRPARHLAALAWDALHSSAWHAAELSWRQAYAVAQMSLALALAADAREAVRLLDLALLLGAPPVTDLVHRLVDHLAAQLDVCAAVQVDDGVGERSKRARVDGPDARDLVAAAALPIERVSSLSVEAFRERYLQTSTPVIITDAMDAWPARNQRSWADLGYLKRVAGFRWVPIEIGRHYLDDDWRQEMMPLDRFIDEFVAPNRAGGYLAQTELFDQIRCLARDIATPDYCATGGVHNIGEFERLHEPAFAREMRLRDAADGRVAIHAWFGPGGTTSPCHHDPSNNLLCQVVGAKLVRLFDPKHTPSLYPHDKADRMRWNSSRVQPGVRDADLDAYPLLRDVPFFECLLAPGEMLFIPPRWWHAVDAVTRSFSVSFWWF
jgi:hypothetical protein